jgi:hypothetical protein
MQKTKPMTLQITGGKLGKHINILLHDTSMKSTIDVEKETS